MCLGTTGNGPRPEDGQAPDQRVAPRTNGPKKMTGTEIAAGETAHGAGTAAGPGLGTENAPGRCTASPVVLFYCTNSKWTIIITIFMMMFWNVYIAWKMFFNHYSHYHWVSFYTLNLCCAGAPGAGTGGDPGAEKGGDLIAGLGLGDPDLVAPAKADERKSAYLHKSFDWTLCSYWTTSKQTLCPLQIKE